MPFEYRYSNLSTYCQYPILKHIKKRKGLSVISMFHPPAKGHWYGISTYGKVCDCCKCWNESCTKQNQEKIGKIDNERVNPFKIIASIPVIKDKIDQNCNGETPTSQTWMVITDCYLACGRALVNYQDGVSIGKTLSVLTTNVTKL